MELIYVWIENYRNINKTGYNFSDKFDVSFNEKLVIEKNEFNNGLFSGRVDNISALVGINGSGKTNILDLLGVRREDRASLGKNLNYFFLYYLKENLYAIEGQGLGLIKNQIDSLPGYPFIENAMSEKYALLIRLDSQNLIFENYLQLDERGFHKSLDYISFRYQYDNFTYKPYRSFEINDESSVFFKRLNLSPLNTGNEARFKMLVDLKKDSKNYHLNSQENFGYASIAGLIVEPAMRFNEDINIAIKDFNRMGSSIASLRLGQNKKESNVETKLRFINDYMRNFCLSIVSYIWEASSSQSQKDSFIEAFNQYEENLLRNKKADNKLYYKELVVFLLEEYKRKNKYILEEPIKSFYNETIDFFEKLDESYFSINRITIPINDLTEYNEVIKFLKSIDYNNVIYEEEMRSILTTFRFIYFPLSSGESALLSLFSAIYYGVTLRPQTDNGKEKLIILIDEPEQYLHPEWSRLLINSIVNFLDNIEKGYKSYQIILTTHSPFLLSDLPSRNIITVQGPHKNDLNLGAKHSFGETFAANIHTLLSDEFFMSSTIGEFAKLKINEIINFLNDKEDKGKYSREYVDYIISIIGEPVIRRKLEVMRNDKFFNSKNREERILRLKAELEELENYDPDT